MIKQSGFQLPQVDFQTTMCNKTLFQMGEEQYTYNELFYLLHVQPFYLVSIATNSTLLHVVKPFGFVTLEPLSDTETYWSNVKEDGAIGSMYSKSEQKEGEASIFKSYEELMKDMTSIPIYKEEIHNQILEAGVRSDLVDDLLSGSFNTDEEEDDPKFSIEKDTYTVSKEHPFEKGFIKGGTVVPFSMLENLIMLDTESGRDTEYDGLMKTYEEANN